MKHLKHKSKTHKTLENRAFIRAATTYLVGNCGGAGLPFLHADDARWMEAQAQVQA
jgi:hypothetical protein